MKSSTMECSILLEKLLKRDNLNPAEISQEAGVPSDIITRFCEDGDFRHVADLWMIDKLLVWLKPERAIYASRMLMDFTADELLKEIKERLESG